MNGVFDDLLALRTSGRIEDRKVHDDLVYKYLVWTPAEQVLPDAWRLKQKNIIETPIDLHDLHHPHFNLRAYYNLMDGRPVQAPKDVFGLGVWYEISGKRGDNFPPSVELKEIPGSEQFSLKDSLVKEGLAGKPEQMESWIRQLEKGEKIEATLNRNGATEKRIVSLSPGAVRPFLPSYEIFKMDLKASREKGLYRPEPGNLRNSIDRYYAAQKKAMHDKAEKWQQKMEGKSQTNGMDVIKIRHGRHIG